MLSNAPGKEKVNLAQHLLGHQLQQETGLDRPGVRQELGAALPAAWNWKKHALELLRCQSNKKSNLGNGNQGSGFREHAAGWVLPT